MEFNDLRNIYKIFIKIKPDMWEIKKLTIVDVLSYFHIAWSRRFIYPP
jgi:hypothetical protein